MRCTAFCRTGRSREWRGSAVEIFMYDDANLSRVLWVYEDRETAANMDKKTRTRSVMDRVVSVKACAIVRIAGMHCACII